MDRHENVVCGHVVSVYRTTRLKTTVLQCLHFLTEHSSKNRALDSVTYHASLNQAIIYCRISITSERARNASPCDVFGSVGKL
jgi:hypothetical protein